MNELINRLYEQNINDLPDTVEEAYKQGLEDMFNTIKDMGAYLIETEQGHRIVIGDNIANVFDKLKDYSKSNFVHATSFKILL